MSNTIRYDALLVHYLARELDERLAGQRLRAARFDPDQRRFALEMDEETLVWELHATRGWLRAVPGTPEGGSTATQGWAARDIRIKRRARILRVSAAADDRLLDIVIDAGGADRAARFVIELLTNQWNVAALDPAGRMVAVLWAREVGGRTLRRGVSYAPPAAREPRAGLDAPVDADTFRALLAGVEPSKRKSALLRGVAWTSPLNAWAIVGDAERDELPDDAYARYLALASRPEPRPRILALDRPTLYPLPLPGVDDRPVPSLLAGMEALAAEEAPAGMAPEVRAALEDRRDHAAHRADRLRAEMEAARPKAAALRHRADLLMAQLHTVPKGAGEVELDDFEGGAMVVKLDPARTAAENAGDLYDRARKRQRAAERLPSRVRAAERERDRLDALIAAMDRGDADPEEVARWVKEVRPSGGQASDDEDRLPYRAFRSSGGLEIRVGRSGRANDALTFRHSSPDDVWLHARDVAGAHVILRWTDRDQNPPRRDLIEAAVLAALNSRARTSGTVPVDWTRRKYVRKPRKAPPGAVLPERVETVFVEPNPELPERLSDPAPPAAPR